MTTKSTEQTSLSPDNLALACLGWILADQPRAERLLDLTGLTPDILRDRLAEKRVQAAILEFLVNHEPDLVKAADELQVSPSQIVSAHEFLSQ